MVDTMKRQDQQRRSLADPATCAGCRRTATLVDHQYVCEKCDNQFEARQPDSELLEGARVNIVALEFELARAEKRIAELETRLAMRELLRSS